jgi:hypothetical protein
MDASELKALMEQMVIANKTIQLVNDKLGPDETTYDKDWHYSRFKVNIPARYIRTVSEFRQRLKCINDDVLNEYCLSITIM